jgi:hypothetical protein
VGTNPVYGLNGLGGVAGDQALPFTGRPDQDKAGIPSSSSRKSNKAPMQPPATASQVAIGRDGWLYLQGVFDRACHPFIPFGLAAARWESLLRVIRASGRRAELLVAPDKSTIYPEYVAADTPNLACSRPGTEALWRVIESPAAERAGIIGLRRALLAAKRTAGALLYYRTDSHWNQVGSLEMIRAALPPLSAPVRVLPTDVVSSGRIHYSGDLPILIGQKLGEDAPTREIRRSPGAPKVPGRTVLVGDSYAEVAQSQLVPYLSSLRLLYWDDDTARQIADGIANSRDVILETVEREFDFRASNAAFITPRFISMVRSVLRSAPVPAR